MNKKNKKIEDIFIKVKNNEGVDGNTPKIVKVNYISIIYSRRVPDENLKRIRKKVVT